MSVASLLNMTCTIRRKATATNASGEDSGAFSNHATGVRCRFSQLSGKEQYDPSVATVVMAKLFLQYGQDIDEDDEIASVVNEDGTTIVTSALVEVVNRDPGGQRSHVEAGLREVRT